jgi:hypothetical protein
MIEIIINANSTKCAVMQMQRYFGVAITQRYGEVVLVFIYDIGKGTI